MNSDILEQDTWAAMSEAWTSSGRSKIPTCTGSPLRWRQQQLARLRVKKGQCCSVSVFRPITQAAALIEVPLNGKELQTLQAAVKLDALVGKTKSGKAVS